LPVYVDAVLLERMDLTGTELVERTGWEIKPEGACRGEVCVPLRSPVENASGLIDVGLLAEQLGMPVVRDDKHGVWALGPRAAGSVLLSEKLGEIVLDDFQGEAFDVATLRGRKVLLIAWASW
jgi:hypothetical protein